MPDFPTLEFERRLERLHAGMADAGLDALLLTSEAEIRWITGFRTLFWQSPARPWFLVVPTGGAPIAIIPSIGAELMDQTWVSDIRTWSAPHPDDDGVSLLLEALSPFANIGLPMGREASLRMPLGDFQRLQAGLVESQFVCASQLLNELRQVKSPLEIEAIETMCQIAGRAFARAPQLFSEGQSLEQAFRAFKIALLEEGAEDVPYLVGGAGQGGYGDVISPPGDQPLRQGDVLMLDTGATRHGYFCDYDRNFAISQADPRAQRGYDCLWRATEAGLDAARPGASMADLFHSMQIVIDAEFPAAPGQAGSVGRMGHGLGMQLTETPSIVAWDTSILKPGMVITLEPSLTMAEGCMMVHEENLVITEEGCRLLTPRAAPELPIL